MKCFSCGAADFASPQLIAALEIWHCKHCGAEELAHSNYAPTLSELATMPRSRLFVGTAFIAPGSESLKALFKLKKALAFAERFSPFKLEEQHREGKLTWDLGDFLDFEVQRAAEECSRIAVRTSFKEVEL